MEDDKLKEACQIVERHARSVGRDCQIIFTADGVQIAPLSWSGDIVEPTLYEAIKTALEDPNRD